MTERVFSPLGGSPVLDVLRQTRNGVATLFLWGLCGAALATILLMAHAQGVGAAVVGMLLAVAWLLRDKPGPWMVLAVALSATFFVRVAQSFGF